MSNSGPLEDTPGPVNTTDWTFLAATYDQNAQYVTAYVDIDSSTTSDPLVAVTERAGFTDGLPTFAIGGLRPDNSNEAWVGAIDNVFLYSGILLQDEMTRLRDLGKSAALGSGNFRITSVVRNANGKMSLTWNSAPGSAYKVLYNTNVSAPLSAWTVDSDNIAGQGATSTFTTATTFNQGRVFFLIQRK